MDRGAWDHKESDMTEQITHTHTHTHTPSHPPTQENLVVDSKWEERYPLPVVQSVKEVMNLYKFYSIFSHGSYESEGEPVNNTY